MPRPTKGAMRYIKCHPKHYQVILKRCGVLKSKCFSFARYSSKTQALKAAKDYRAELEKELGFYLAPPEIHCNSKGEVARFRVAIHSQSGRQPARWFKVEDYPSVDAAQLAAMNFKRSLRGLPPLPNYKRPATLPVWSKRNPTRYSTPEL